MQYPEDLTHLINLLRKLPGVGYKSAERHAFALLDWQKAHLQDLSNSLATIKESLRYCEICGSFETEGRCPFCSNASRDRQVMCITATPKEVYAIEETHEFKGMYHVLGALLSPIDGIGTASLHLERVLERIAKEGTKEVIIALDSTLEGDTTALYLKKELANSGASVSRLAFGLPMGSSLEYVDGGTLALAMSGRRSF